MAKYTKECISHPTVSKSGVSEPKVSVCRDGAKTKLAWGWVIKMSSIKMHAYPCSANCADCARLCMSCDLGPKMLPVTYCRGRWRSWKLAGIQPGAREVSHFSSVPSLRVNAHSGSDCDGEGDKGINTVQSQAASTAQYWI